MRVKKLQSDKCVECLSVCPIAYLKNQTSKFR